MPGTELSGRHRPELALLADVEGPDGTGVAGTVAKLIRYAEAEGLTPEMFTVRDTAELPLVDALRHPGDFGPGSVGHAALVAAGIVPGP